MPKPGAGHYEGLDALRGVAAIAVVLYHRRWWHAEGPFLEHAFLAVDFFFALSGFVIAHAYQRRLQQGMALGEFVALRLIRLLPMLLLAGAVAASLPLWRVLRHGVVVEDAVWWAVLANALALPTPVVLAAEPEAPFPMNDPSWSLCFELAMNLAFALAVPWLTRARLVAAIGLGLLALAWAAWGNPEGLKPLGNTWQHLAAGVPRTSFSFLLGVALYRLQAAAPRGLPGAVALAGALLVASFTPPLAFDHTRAYQLACVALLYPAIIVFVARQPSGGRWARLARGLGAVSYPLYILHDPLYAWLDRVLTPDVPGRLWIALAVIVAASAAALRLVDEPVRRRLSRWQRQRAARRAGAPNAAGPQAH